MDVTTTLICGDEDETSVFATSHLDDISILFQFCFDAAQPTSLNSRIVACFHDFEIQEAGSSLRSREEMRQSIRSLIKQVWQECAWHPLIRRPDTIVRIQESLHGRMLWSISPEDSYQDYIRELISVELIQSASSPDSQPTRTQFASLEHLRFSHVLGGRGDTTIVHFENAKAPKTMYVYKGLSFRLFLELGTGYSHEKQTFYHELGLICSLPKHPNIVSPPCFLVTTRPVDVEISPTSNNTYVCGSLYPYLERQSLQEVLNEAIESRERLPLQLKAKWAYQITSALVATHESHQYHMDLKPSNILVDNDENAVLIDWEQCGASPFFLAPEANGSWDVKIKPRRNQQERSEISEQDVEKPELIYQKYTGKPRRNHWSWPEWNVFPIWQIECPYALRAAEVYSLGRTLWVIFQQIGHVDIVANRDEFAPELTLWAPQSNDLPDHWKDFVDQCVDPDPNGRPKLDTALSFWEHEISEIT